MSKLAQRQRNLARRTVQGKRRQRVQAFTVKNVGTRKTLTVNALTAESALTKALSAGLAKSLDKLVVVA